MLRVYADTSVLGGCFDAIYATDSRRFLDSIQAGRVVLLVSDLVTAELANAPDAVRDLLAALPMEVVEPVPITEEVLALRDAYVSAGIVGARWLDDAGHVAAATMAEADAIVSWNFRHLVRLDKMKAYNAINQRHGYKPITIITPNQVTYDEGNADD